MRRASTASVAGFGGSGAGAAADAARDRVAESAAHGGRVRRSTNDLLMRETREGGTNTPVPSQIRRLRMPRYNGMRGGSWFLDGPRSSASPAAAGRTAGGSAKAIAGGPEGERAVG